MAWRQYICELDGKLASVLVDQRFENEFPLKELSKLFWVAVYFNFPSDESFWHPDEASALEDIENNLIKLAQSFGSGWIVYLIRIDTKGVREYFFYYGENADIDKTATLLKSLHPAYRIESDAKEDAEWDEYRKYLTFENNENVRHD